MKIIKTKFSGLKIIVGSTFYDQRGFFREIFKNRLIKNYKPIFWCTSKSKQNVLRGLHLQKISSQAKIVCVLKGKILDVVVYTWNYFRILKNISSSTLFSGIRKNSNSSWSFTSRKGYKSYY